LTIVTTWTLVVGGGGPRPEGGGGNAGAEGREGGDPVGVRGPGGRGQPVPKGGGAEIKVVPSRRTRTFSLFLARNLKMLFLSVPG